MRLHGIWMILAGLLLWTGCEKVESTGLQGTWEPIYASGDYEDFGYHYTFAGALDAKGYIAVVGVGVENPDARDENTFRFPGYRFYQKDGKDMFITFFKGTSSWEVLGGPLEYRVENGEIFLELPKGAYIDASHLEELAEGSGIFSEGIPFTFLENGQLQMGGVIYQRK